MTGGRDAQSADESVGEGSVDSATSGTRAPDTSGLAPESGSESTSAAGDGDVRRCDFCRLPCPTDVVTLERDGVTYRFCSQSCKQALSESDRVFTQYHGFRRTATGIDPIDGTLPMGVPRNSFVLLTGLDGTRTQALRAELAWRALQRGEPVVYVSFLEPPVSLVQGFLDLEWNVLPSLERGNLRIVDCFTYRVADRDRMYERLDEWNTHLWNVAEPATDTVRDPSDMQELQNRLDGALEDLGMQDDGIVVVDSLTELGSLIQPIQAYDLVKDVRADVCKGRFVPVFAGATVTGDGDGFPHDLGYMADGIVEMRLNEELVENALVKQLRIRKMNGVLSYPTWLSYEYTPGTGLVSFDPVAQRAENAEDADGAESAGDGGDADTAGNGDDSETTTGSGQGEATGSRAGVDAASDAESGRSPSTNADGSAPDG